MAGNSNSGSHKDKLFRNALIMELKVRDAGDDHKTLRQIAGDVIEIALTKNPMIGQLKRDAITMIADRIDGKPAQAIIGGDEDDPAIMIVNEIRRTIVDPNPNPDDPNSTGIPAASTTRKT